MSDKLKFDDRKYTVETLEMEGRTLTFRAFENIPYVEHPADSKMQRLSIFVPEGYYEGQKIGPYDLKNAPIFMPNTVGGYMPGPQERPGRDFMGRVNASFFALLHGYVVVSPGVRGREMKDENGTFKEFVASVVAASAQKEIDLDQVGKENAETGESDLSTDRTENRRRTQHPGMPPYADPMEQEWLTVKEGKVTDVDFSAYVRFRTRMKQMPAFDNTSLGTPENELFGNADTQFRHFTEFSASHSKAGGEMAEEPQIRMMNPMYYIEDEKADKARHYRIRHGSVDRDTSLAISAMLALKLKNQGVDTDLAYPWGLPHAGDYDLEELFAWIDEICAE